MFNTSITDGVGAIVVTAALVLSGCASTPDRMAELEQAKTAVATAGRDPLAEKAAGIELKEARQELAAAQSAWESDKDADVVRYHAYMATGYAKIVEERTEESRIRDKIEKSEAKRDQILLAARSSEVESLSSQLRALKAEQTDRGPVLTLGDLLFATDKAQLQPGARSTINELADFMKEYPERRILVEGYTDSTGSSGYNLDLSRRRADAVANALFQQGIARDRIGIKALGENYPVASNDTSAGRQENRRVEVVISGENGSFPATTMR